MGQHFTHIFHLIENPQPPYEKGNALSMYTGSNRIGKKKESAQRHMVNKKQTRALARWLHWLER